MTAFQAEGYGIALRAMLIKSALRDWLSVSYGMIRIPVIDSLRSPPKGETAEWYMKYMTLCFSSPYFSFPLEGNASKRQRVYKAERRFDTPSLFLTANRRPVSFLFLTLGHTFGVRVQRVLEKVLKMDRPLAGGFLSLTGLWPEGCGGGFAASLLKSALRDWLSMSYGMISILRIGSLRSPPPIRLRRTFPHPGDRINRSMLSCRDMAPRLSIHSPTTKWWQGNLIRKEP